jgi:hypothetical protein
MKFICKFNLYIFNVTIFHIFENHKDYFSNKILKIFGYRISQNPDTLWFLTMQKTEINE